MKTISVEGMNGIPVLAEVAGYDPRKDSNPDAMHLIENVFDNIMSIIKGSIKDLKVSEIKKRRNESDDQFRTRQRKNQNTQRMYNVCNKSMAALRLSASQLDEIDRRYKSIRAPSGMRSGTLPMKHTGSFKAADWVFFIRYAGEWIMDGLLPAPQLEAWKRLMSLLRFLCQYEITRNSLQEYENNIIDNMEIIEKAFPAICLGLWFHYLYHMPEFVRAWGPPYVFWMFRFERLIGNSI